MSATGRNWPKSYKKLDEMTVSLKPLAALLPWRRSAPHADDLYDAIMAQTRLPIYYQRFGVPDTLEGRFTVLSLHLFAVLHRLKREGAAGAATAQALSDRFAADMETVLREVGVGDLSVPKKVRKLVAEGAGLLEGYERAVARGGEALQNAIADALPLDSEAARAVSAELTPYLNKTLQDLDSQPLEAIREGKVRFPEMGGT
ncbi:MAG: ubiquinol-cytochrome C chaperone [Hyphomicrobiaceae bacterium]|nr:ubiquinol-cytochrome C chaperone [Hyphomicrobiaceae bacterium]